MRDNIIIEKIWQDKDFFEVSIKCSNNKISAITEIYLTNELIDELYEKIEFVLQFQKKNIKWESGMRGNGSTSCVEFDITMKDKSGHINIEVYMELNDGGCLEKHHCCFYVNTELGLLYEFNNHLMCLKDRVIGRKVSLMPENH